MSATAEAIDNLRRLSDSIKKKIQEQEKQNQRAKEKIKFKYSSMTQNSQVATGATSSSVSKRQSFSRVEQ